VNHIKFLEFQRLIRELQFVESDYNYQSEIIRISDIEFLKNVDDILSKSPELKEIYYKKKDLLINRVINMPLIEDKSDLLVTDVETDNLEVKKLYRNIVKATHPDKIKNSILNDLYMEATKAYENNDIVTLYKVCSDLNISFDLPDDFIVRVKDRIDLIKKQVSFLENTYTFKWIKSSNIQDKNKIIIEYIRSKIY
jgi:hypothetical protein